jgi:hypothetical protein
MRRTWKIYLIVGNNNNKIIAKLVLKAGEYLDSIHLAEDVFVWTAHQNK